jgi:hypothetical protein
VPVQGGGSYRLRFWARARGLASAGVVTIYNAAGDQQLAQAAFPVPPGTYGWRQVEIPFTVPRAAASLRELRFSHEGSGTLWVDDVSLEQTGVRQLEGKLMPSAAFFAILCPSPAGHAGPQVESVSADGATLARVRRPDGSREEILYNPSGRMAEVEGVASDARLAVLRYQGQRLVAWGVVDGAELRAGGRVFVRARSALKIRARRAGRGWEADAVAPQATEVVLGSQDRVTLPAGRTRRAVGGRPDNAQ